jgi:DNA-binding CsgD family transcriptional regulator
LKEVAGRMIAAYVEIAKAQGLDPAELLRGLPLDPTDLKTRVSWDATIELIRRIRDGLGGNTAIEDAFVRFEPTSPDLVALTSHLVSPMALARFINTTMASGIMTPLTSTMTERSGQRYDLRIQVARGYESDLATVYASVGLLRGHPLLLGLPEANVTWRGVATDFTCHVTLPPAQDVGARLRRLTQDARERADLYLGAMAVDRANHQHHAANIERVLNRLGDAAHAPSTSEQFAEVATESLRETLGHTFSFLWSTTHPGRRLLASHGTRGDRPTVVPIEAAGKRVGILETDPIDGRQSLAALVPVLALGLLQRAQREQPPAATGTFPDEWSLTKRQREITELVALGQSNPTIAAALGCTVGTVEAHLTVIFQKAGVAGRLLLASRLVEFRRATVR